MSMRSEWIVDKTEAVSGNGMVTAMQPAAADAGAQILRRGGNAIDAAVATAFAVGVVEPFMSGVGGVAWLVYHDAAADKTYCLDGSTVLPAAVRPEMFEVLDEGRSGIYGWRATKDDAAQTGWRAPGVPGTPMLLQDAHRRWGRLPWRDVVEPAIVLAAEGFEVNHYVAMMISASARRLWRFPEGRRTFFKQDGTPLAPSLGQGPGDRLVQPDLARTLKTISDEGADTVYRGRVARLIVEDMQRNAGLVTQADLAAHKTLEYQPAEIDYRGYQVVGQLENSGFPTLAEALQILDGFDLAGIGFQTVEAEHLMIEAMRRAFVDRLRHIGDASLVPVPLRGMVGRDYAAERRATIDPVRATPDEEPGDPWPHDPTPDGRRAARSGATGEGQTTHMNVVDRDGNLASLTSTLGAAFGSAVVINGTGITLNNATMWFDPVPGSVASIGPGKRILSAATPVLVRRNGAPFMTAGSPGGRRVISAVMRVILNVVDFGLGMQAAVSAPRSHCEGRPATVSNRFPAAVPAGLRGLGHDLQVVEDNLSTNWFARPSAIMIHPATGERRGGVFQFTPATAVGV